MDTKALMKWLLMAGAAYLVYRYLQSAGYLSPSPAVVPGQATSQLPAETTQPYQEQTQPGTTTSPSTVAAAANAELRTKLAQASADDATGTFDVDGVTRMHNFYHFNYMYNAITGHSLPDPGVLGIADPNQDMTFDEFWAILTAARAAGVTVGLPGLSGQGAHRLGSGPSNLSALYRLASAWA